MSEVRIHAWHEDFLVIDKAAGQPFHHDAEQPGLAELVRQATGIAALYPVHRLDTLTSGLILLARSSDAARALSDQFASHRIDKFYLALSSKKPAKKQGWVKGSMSKGRNGNWKLGHGDELPAATQFFSAGLGNGLRAFLLRPLSGRTHQLRVALKSLGSPILGDTRYGGMAADRGYLHAYALQLNWQGERLRWTLPPATGTAFADTAFKDWLARSPAPWDWPWPAASRPSARQENE
ncbi:TIGR01621 family pseudouridine synthase [Chitinilyticum piscinae]|uniref:TIGR01621 family pseudouridine synthase n=1 Tax=Chitinilyticum piscinae TaxID=2866724 RepID=A0A8J7FPD3_9NEIS|nr:TIGR01621 family pseudouridine synthase [Chitinilyticum piscinae]MBE9610621.1 TIGR01621 family pseudouridine synthase [Chitinilyticum piscinae]